MQGKSNSQFPGPAPSRGRLDVSLLNTLLQSFIGHFVTEKNKSDSILDLFHFNICIVLLLLQANH